jgi:hypothetical protein
MSIIKTPEQRVVSISMDSAGNITHAWQTTQFVLTEDGIEISRAQSGQENIEPKDIGKVFPQAKLLRQITDLQRDKGDLRGASEDLVRANGELAAEVGRLQTKLSQMSADAEQKPKEAFETVHPPASL